jgi:adenylate kinase family enzyme
MRVYFIGAHSTGKTTMARYVSKKTGLPLLPEVARMVLAERELAMESLRSDLDIVDSFQREIFSRQIAIEKDLDAFVSDRSFDNLAYAAQHARVLRSILSEKSLTEYIDRMRGPDTLLFYIRPVQTTLRNDGVREQVDWDELIRIDGAIKFMLEMWGLDYYMVCSGSMQERARLVDSILRRGPAFHGEKGKPWTTKK